MYTGIYSLPKNKMKPVHIKKDMSIEEINNTLLAASWGVTPRILKVTDSSIEMERYYCTYLDYINMYPQKDRTPVHRQITALLSVIHSHDYIHGNIHEENIVLNVNQKGDVIDVKLVDFKELKAIDISPQKEVQTQESEECQDNCKWIPPQ